MNRRPSFGSLEKARRALHEQSLEYATQPIRSYRDGVWHPQRSEWLVRPQRNWSMTARQFVDGLISLGLQVELDIRVVRDAISFLGRRPGLTLAVNVSADGISSTDLSRTILSELSSHGIEGDRLYLEITEHRPIKSVSEVIRQASRLKNRGLRIGMDHVGVRERRFPLALLQAGFLDHLKLDAAVLGQPTEQLAAVMAHADRSNVDLAVERVETSDQCERCLELGLRQAQGYYWDIPEIEAYSRPNGELACA